ncbi:MAG: hypothetical protein IPO58_14035 [Betaproteobacteria bacterium]|nr:hypothetical protein [Betaproteobacteria bacterium]
MAPSRQFAMPAGRAGKCGETARGWSGVPLIMLPAEGVIMMPSRAIGRAVRYIPRQMHGRPACEPKKKPEENA